MSASFIMLCSSLQDRNTFVYSILNTFVCRCSGKICFQILIKRQDSKTVCVCVYSRSVCLHACIPDKEGRKWSRVVPASLCPPLLPAIKTVIKVDHSPPPVGSDHHLRVDVWTCKQRMDGGQTKETQRPSNLGARYPGETVPRPWRERGLPPAIDLMATQLPRCCSALENRSPEINAA